MEKETKAVLNSKQNQDGKPIRNFRSDYKGSDYGKSTCPLLNINEASEFIDYKVSTIYSMVHNRTIPHFKRGKRLFFDKDQLLAWLTKDKRLSNEELAIEAERFANRRRDRL